MPSAPNLNPPASSAAVQRHALLAGVTQGGNNQDSNKGKERATRVTARTAAEFHEPLNRGLAVAVTWTPGEPVGLMVEGGDAVEELAAARSDRRDPEYDARLTVERTSASPARQLPRQEIAR